MSNHAYSVLLEETFFPPEIYGLNSPVPLTEEDIESSIHERCGLEPGVSVVAVEVPTACTESIAATNMSQEYVPLPRKGNVDTTRQYIPSARIASHQQLVSSPRPVHTDATPVRNGSSGTVQERNMLPPYSPREEASASRKNTLSMKIILPKKNKKVIGDDISDSDREGSISSKISKKRPASPKQPMPQISKKAKHNNFSRLEQIAGVSSTPSTTEKRRVNFDDNIETSSVCSKKSDRSNTSRKSDRSHASRKSDRSNGSRKNDKSDHNGGNGQSGRSDRVSVDSGRIDGLYNGECVSANDTRPPTTPYAANPIWCLDPDKVRFDPGVLIDSPRSEYTKFQHNHNEYIASATRSIIDGIILKSIDNEENVDLTFKSVVIKMVRHITKNILKKECFNQAELVSIIHNTEIIKDTKKVDALCVATGIMNSAMSRGKLVTLSWDTVKNWAMGFSQTLVKTITAIELDIVRKGKTVDRPTLSSYFDKLVDDLDNEIHLKHAGVMDLFFKMGLINELALYIIFGLNLNKKNEITTDLLAKTIIASWLKYKKSIVVLQNEGDSEKNMEIFWNLPIAYAVQLHDLGKEKIEEEGDDQPRETLANFLDDFLPLNED